METKASERMKIGIMVVPIPFPPNSTPSPWGTEPVVNYAETRAMAVQAEAAGFDSIWVFDHLLLRYPDQPPEGVWECWTVLSALAEATQRVEIGALVICTAFRSPALLAKMAVTLDEVSNGRLILGLGSGWHQPEFDGIGIPFDAKVDRFAEALAIIAPLLREGRTSFAGDHYWAKESEILPRGPRPQGPPILIGSRTGSRMMRLTARYADYWNTGWMGGTAERLVESRHTIDAACAAEGRDPATLGVTVGVRVICSTPAGYTEPLPNRDRALSGSPEEIAAGLRTHAEAGVAHVICSLTPSTLASLAHLTEALAIYRGMIA
jgi:alkanesulfonate monooxygenase SsuD/methylene tetrahydromethanopterin reductase-like flavin-dependent oxidoreductase (luciferase family)